MIRMSDLYKEIVEKQYEQCAGTGTDQINNIVVNPANTGDKCCFVIAAME